MGMERLEELRKSLLDLKKEFGESGKVEMETMKTDANGQWSLHKATHPQIAMPSDKKVAEFKAKQAMNDPSKKRAIPKENMPMAGETQDAHKERVVSRLSAKYPKLDPKAHHAAAATAWEEHAA